MNLRVRRERLDPYVRRVGLVTVLGSVMSVLDTTIVNVALDSLARKLHTDIATIQWVVTGYLLALAATVPVSAWAARRIGIKRLYLVSLLVFTIGSALCGLAWSAGSLIFFRVLQGIGGGMIMPVGQMIIVKTAGKENLGRVMGVLSTPTVLAPVLGPTLGGDPAAVVRLAVDLPDQRADRRRRADLRASASCPATSPRRPASSTSSASCWPPPARSR